MAGSEARRPDKSDAEILEAHARSRRGCDPARKCKPRCPARQCKETLTFSNTSHCKGCGQKLCLKHRFPADHERACVSPAGAAAAVRRAGGNCWRDEQKTKDGGGWALPPLIRNFKMF